MSERTRLEGIRERDGRGRSLRPSYIALRIAEGDRRWLLERVDECKAALENAGCETGGMCRVHSVVLNFCGTCRALAALHAKETDRG